MSQTHLSTRQLAERWAISSRTLEAWRNQGTGPCYLKIGQQVRYSASDIEKYEQQYLRHGTGQAAFPAQ